MVQARAMEACDQPAGFLPRRVGRGDVDPLGERVHAIQALDQDRGAITRAPASIARGQRARHRQAARMQRARQPELGEAANAVGAVPDIAIATDVGRPAAAQVVAEHHPARGVFVRWRVDEPRPAAPAHRHRPGALAPMARGEPFGLDLPRAFGVEQNRAIPFVAPVASILEWRQAFSWRRMRPSSESSKATCPIPRTPWPSRHARSACCASRRWATSPTSYRWCARCVARGPTCGWHG